MHYFEISMFPCFSDDDLRYFLFPASIFSLLSPTHQKINWPIIWKKKICKRLFQKIFIQQVTPNDLRDYFKSINENARIFLQQFTIHKISKSVFICRIILPDKPRTKCAKPSDIKLVKRRQFITKSCAT